MSAPGPERIRTERLVLRRWRAEDVAAYAALQADPETRRFYPSLLTYEESAAEVDRHVQGFSRDGFGVWVVAKPEDDALVGFAGVRRIPRAMPFTPLIDLVWFLHPSLWGQGYALEAAKAALDDVFTRTEVEDVVAYTARPNVPSQRVMEKLGMTRDPAEDFAHPAAPEGHPLQMCVLYRLTRQAFLAREAEAEATP